MYMKLSRHQLRALIREAIDIIQFDDIDDDGRELGHDNNNGRMVKSQLFKIAKYAQSLHDTLRDEDEIPNWAFGKISVMSNDIDKIKHFLDYKIKRVEEDEDY